MINKAVQFFIIILFCSFPISMTGVEIGRYGLLLSLMGAFIIYIVKKLKKRPMTIGESPFSLISTDVFLSYKAGLNGMTFYLRRMLPAIFLFYCLLYALSFLTTPYLGDKDNGSLDYLSSFLPSIIATWLSYKYLNVNSLRKTLIYLLLFFLASHFYSFYGVFVKGENKALGFYFYPTVYARVLSVEYSIIMVLLFHHFNKWMIMFKNKKVPWLFLFLVLLLVLFFYDMSLNKSRLLIMVVLAIPTLLFLFYNLRHFKRLLLLPIIFIVCFVFLTEAIKTGFLHHFHFYHKSPLPMNLIERENAMELLFLDRNAFDKTCHIDDPSYPSTMKVRLLDEETNSFFYHEISDKKYLFGEELKEGEKKTYAFEFHYGENSPNFMNTLLIVITKNQNNYDFKVVEAFSRISLRGKPLSDLISDYSLSHLRMDFFQPSRSLIYKSTFSMIEKNLWLGNGPGTWKNFVTNIKYNDYAHLYLHSSDNNHYHPHNNFLQVCYDSGLITLLVWLFFLSSLVFVNLDFLIINAPPSLRHSQYDLYLMIFFCFITLNICGIFDGTIYDSVSGAVLGALVGILMKP